MKNFKELLAENEEDKSSTNADRQKLYELNVQIRKLRDEMEKIDEQKKVIQGKINSLTSQKDRIWGTGKRFEGGN